MGSLYICDTGYVKPTNEGTQALAGNRSNAGLPFSLKTAEFTPSLARNLSDQPDIGTNLPGEVDIGALQNMQFKLRCVINSTISTDMSYVVALLNLVVTQGYKLLWYQYSDAVTEKNSEQLVYQIALNSRFGHQTTDAEKTAFAISDNFYHLHVLFKDISPRHIGGKGLIMYELSGVVLKVETSILT